MRENNLPSVGIGLPVYNNSKHLAKTLDSLLNQTYPNITIYLSDNCSNDGTDTICKSYAKKDKRIKYSRNEKNIGAADNYRKVLALSSTEYFMFARGHEILSPHHFEDCFKILKEDRNVVLAFATTQWIDEEDNIISDKPFSHFDTRGCDVVTRCALVLWGNHEYLYGLMSTKTMKSIWTCAEIIGLGFIIMLQLALLGSFAHIDSRNVRYRRYHYSGETYRKRIQRYKKSTFRQLKTVDYFFPLARLPYYLFLSVIKSKVSTSDKIKIILIILFNAPFKYAISKGKQL